MKSHLLPILFLGLLGSSSARAELLINEPFLYEAGNVSGNTTAALGLTGDWVASDQNGGTNPNAAPTFLFDSLEFARHFAPTGGALEVRNAAGGIWTPVGASIGLNANLDVPVLWTSSIIRVASPNLDYYNDWVVEQRLNTSSGAGGASTALRVMGRTPNSGQGRTITTSRAGIGADHAFTTEPTSAQGSIAAGVNYLYVTKSTIEEGRITSTTLYVFNEAKYAEYQLEAITSGTPAGAEAALANRALFSITDTDTDAGSTSENILNKTVMQFSITGGPVGAFDEVRFGTALADVVNLTAVPTFDLAVESSNLSFTGGTIVIADVETAKFDTAPARAGEIQLQINGFDVDFQVSRDEPNGLTTFTFPFDVEPSTFYSVYLSVPTAGRDDDFQDFFIDFDSYRLPQVIPGPEGTVGGWAIREFFNPVPPDPEAPPGEPVPPTAASIADAVAVALAQEAGTFVEATDVPVLNHSDPDSNGALNSGNFNNDFNILSDTPGVNDGWVVVAKTKLNIPAAGTYTFSVHSDDGFAVRIAGGAGGKFISAHGSGAVDSSDPQTLFLDGGTGDSNTRGVYRFDGAGVYDVTYLGWDGGGAGFHELAWAQGTFTHNRDTNTWSLVGNPAHPSVTAIPFRERFIAELPGPPATAGNFSIRTYLGATGTGNIDATNNFVRDTTRTPENPGASPVIDVQRQTLNARDPEDGQNYMFPAEPFPGNTSANDNDVVTVAKGRFVLPTTQTYTFWVQSDDGFMLRLKGADGTPDPTFLRATQGDSTPSANGTFQMSNPNELYFAGGTGNTNTRGIIELPAGTYDIDFMHWEGGGGFGYELSAAPGSWPHGTTPPSGWHLVGFTPAVAQLTVPRINDAGWTVEASNAGRTELEGAGFNIAGAEAAITNALAGGVGSTTTADYVDFIDPQSGSQGHFGNSNPWPLNTPGDDDRYAIRATGILVVTEPGVYHLGFQGDDGGYMQIDGPIGQENTAQWTSIVETLHPTVATLVQGDSGSGLNNRIRTELGTGNSRTIGAINLAAGTYTIKTLVYEGGGGSWWEVVGAKAPDVTLPQGFPYPLLRKAAGSTYTVPNGLPLIAQTAVAGTPPGTRIPVSTFTTSGSPPTSATISFASESGRTYKIRASTDLVNWIDVQAALPASGTGTTTQVVDLTAYPALNGQPKVFFQVVIN